MGHIRDDHDQEPDGGGDRRPLAWAREEHFTLDDDQGQARDGQSAHRDSGSDGAAVGKGGYGTDSWFGMADDAVGSETPAGSQPQLEPGPSGAFSCGTTPSGGASRAPADTGPSPGDGAAPLPSGTASADPIDTAPPAMPGAGSSPVVSAAPAAGGTSAGGAPAAGGDALGWGDAAWAEAGGFDAILNGMSPEGGFAMQGPCGQTTIVIINDLDIINNTLIQLSADDGGVVDIGGDVVAVGTQQTDLAAIFQDAGGFDAVPDFAGQAV